MCVFGYARVCVRVCVSERDNLFVCAQTHVLVLAIQVLFLKAYLQINTHTHAHMHIHPVEMCARKHTHTPTHIEQVLNLAATHYGNINNLFYSVYILEKIV